MGATKPFEYGGQMYLNKPVYFRHAIPGLIAMGLLAAIAILPLIISLVVNIYIGVILLVTGFAAIRIFVQRYAKRHMNGERNAIDTDNVWSATPSEIVDKGLFNHIITNHEQFKL